MLCAMPRDCRQDPVSAIGVDGLGAVHCGSHSRVAVEHLKHGESILRCALSVKCTVDFEDLV